MKKFIIRLTLCCIPAMMLLIPVEVLLRRIPNSISSKSSYLDQHSHRIKILILGSSHTYYGINPELLSSSAFNAAHNSQDIEYDYRILNKYINMLDSLNTIIVPISYPSLFISLRTAAGMKYLKNYIRYYKLNPYNEVSFHMETFNMYPNPWNNIYQYYLKGQNILSDSPMGFHTEYSDKEIIENIKVDGKQTALRHHTKDYSELPQIRTYLNSILNLAKKKGAKVILLTPPAYSAYKEHLNKAQLSKMYSEITTILNSNSGVIYKDYLNDPHFTKDDFYDASHLNPTGAEKLTKKIAHIIDSIN